MRLADIARLLAQALALAGGAVLVALTGLTVVSIIGRSLVWAGLQPVPGDFELVEAGVGFAVFAFLPWCQLQRGHARVDLVASILPGWANRTIDVIAEALMTFVLTLIAWRLWFGLHDKMRYGETTFILQFPVWWAFAACMVAAAVAVLVSFHCLGVRLREALRGDTPAGPAPGRPN